MRKTVTVYTSLPLPKIDRRRLGVSRLEPLPISPDDLELYTADTLVVGSDVTDSYALFRDHVPMFLHVVDLHTHANPATWRLFWNGYWKTRDPDVASRFVVDCPYAIAHAEVSGIAAPDHRARLSKALGAMVSAAGKR